jgi:hypothetical protein
MAALSIPLLCNDSVNASIYILLPIEYFYLFSVEEAFDKRYYVTFVIVDEIELYHTSVEAGGEVRGNQ